MSIIPCPRCRRPIRLLPEDLARTIECARCGARFMPQPAVSAAAEDTPPLLDFTPPHRTYPVWLVGLLVFTPAALGLGALALVAFRATGPPTARATQVARQAQPAKLPPPAEPPQPVPVQPLVKPPADDRVNPAPRFIFRPAEADLVPFPRPRQPQPRLQPPVQPLPPPPDGPPTPTPGVLLKEIVPGYETRRIAGFVMFLSTQAIAEATRDNGRPYQALGEEFAGLEKAIPAKALKALRRVRIWIEWDNIDPRDPRVLAKYYAGGVWQLGRGENPLKANGVEVLSLKALTREKHFNAERGRLVLLHELAHAAHHVFLPGGFANPGVQFAYQQAMERRLYHRVQDDAGGIGMAYAAANDREYFAELTCSYLDRGKYFPFTRAELKEHDQAGYRLMETAWGKLKDGPADAAP